MLKKRISINLFAFFVLSFYQPSVLCRVVDSAKNNQELGTVSVDIWKIMEQPGLEYSLQPWTLQVLTPVPGCIAIHGENKSTKPSSLNVEF